MADPLPYDPATDESDVFDLVDEDAEERAFREGGADIAAGRVVPHEEVAKWLQTWGTARSSPPPKSWFK